MRPKEVFLSHSSVNKQIAAIVAETLINHGITVWYSDTQIMNAQQWQDEIGKALKRCDWFLLLLSKHSIKSTWVKRELQYALNHSQYEGHILPIKIEECHGEALSWTLELFQQVNVNGDWDTAWVDILQIWGIGYHL